MATAPVAAAGLTAAAAAALAAGTATGAGPVGPVAPPPGPLIRHSIAGGPHADLYDDGPYRRKGKKKNPLLVRPQVGKVKATTYDLPPAHFAYGKKDQFDEEGVREVVHSWAEHKANAEPPPGRDFVRLNKSAALTGCTTAHHVRDFRKGHDIRLKGSLASGTRQIGLVVDNMQGTTFGRPSKPSTPIGNVLCNVYQRDWITEQRHADVQDSKEKTVIKRSGKLGKFATSQHTRASLGHQKVAAAPAPAPFKLARFADVPSRVRIPKGVKVPSLTGSKSAARLPGASASLPAGTTLPPVAGASSPGSTSEVYTSEQLAAMHDHQDAGPSTEPSRVPR